MPPSQLKRLKASLREQGITGPQKSKKEKKRAGKDVAKRAQRNQALESIRDSFNPFEIKAKARPEKFQSTSLQKQNAKDGMVAVARPGVTKSLGEETRRKMLLPELQMRNKTGGIIDRRIGENDPTMTLEDKMLERFTRERSRKKGNVFDLEDDADEEEVQLTHGGMALDLNGENDDFDAGSLEGGSDDEGDMKRKPKRRRDNDGEGEAEEEEEQPEKKKTKAEVMKEVIAKSKLHKYERQQEKEDDEDLREKLDEGMFDMLAELGRFKKPPPPPKADEASGGLGSMDPERAKMMSQEDKKKADKEYDRLMREMKLDKRAAPTTRVKSDEEKAQEEAERLKELEQKRLKRMKGEDVSSDDEEEDEKMDVESQAEDDEFPDDAAQFGLKDPRLGTLRPDGVDDEDDFEIDGDLVASGSDIDEDDVSSASGEESSSDDEEEHIRQRDEDEEDEFVEKFLGDQEAKTSKLSYTYPCPRSHDELVQVLNGVAATDVPTVVQRIRALYHPQLSAENREKMEDFSKALVDHISFMASNKLPLAPIETLIRHIHSLSRTFPTPIAQQFRSHLSSMWKTSTIAPGDMVILTAIATIYPTSDHFHQVVTPAITIMARWLGLTTPQGPEDLMTGAYVSTLSLKYQTLSKRYIPELVRFTTLALKHPELPKISLTSTYLANVTTMTSLWSTTPAFTEVFTPSLEAALSNLKPKPTKALENLRIQLSQARLARRPQALHNWKPLAIKTAVPKFEDDFNPSKHYDPDQERREAAKLRAEYKREKKGAMRELRKDASFVAREKLREKKERDAAYEAKYKRIVAEIQGEEGREAKAYERERASRKKNRM